MNIGEGHTERTREREDVNIHLLILKKQHYKRVNFYRISCNFYTFNNNCGHSIFFIITINNINIINVINLLLLLQQQLILIIQLILILIFILLLLLLPPPLLLHKIELKKETITAMSSSHIDNNAGLGVKK